MLRSIWLACVLAVSTTAWAQPAQPGSAAVIVEKAAQTARAQQVATVAAQKLVTLTNQQVEQRRRYDEQLAAVYRLKKQKASWRRDRELNKAQADAADTAKRLTALDNPIKAAQQALATARASLVAAVDAELAAGATGARAEQLAKLRAQVSPARPAQKPIVIPNAEINLLADAEELDSQIAALLAAEKKLEAQRNGLDQQHKELVARADLRSAHDRSIDLSVRDDDAPHRGAPRSSSRGGAAADLGASKENDSAPAPGSGSGSSPTGGGGNGDTDTFGSDKAGVGGATGSFEQSTAIALGEVIDKSTIDGMLRASRSGDPKKRAEAAKLARDAVAKQLQQLKQKREAIEKRAKQLRKH